MQTPEQFLQWLQGFAELSTAAPTETQWSVIKHRLGELFQKKEHAPRGVSLDRLSALLVETEATTSEKLAQGNAAGFGRADEVVKNSAEVGNVTHDHMDNRPLSQFVVGKKAAEEPLDGFASGAQHIRFGPKSRFL